MRNAPFTLSAMLMLAVFLCLGVSEANAQGSSWKYCLEDPTCSGAWQDCETPDGNCASYAFTATTTGTYTLAAMILCDHDCHDCEVCVMVQKVPSGAIVGSCKTYCGVQECQWTCSVSLDEDQAYFLYVCKTPCDNSTCEECMATECKGYGCLCLEPSTGPCTP
jgi:hypothetical protein